LNTKDDDVLYTKTAEWEFEKEWRIIRNFNDAAEKVGQDLYGKDILLFDIPPNALRSVVLGYRVTAQCEENVLETICKNATLSHVIVHRAIREANGHIEIKP
jgi:hypothetical protein